MSDMESLQMRRMFSEEVQQWLRVDTLEALSRTIAYAESNIEQDEHLLKDLQHLFINYIEGAYIAYPLKAMNERSEPLSSVIKTIFQAAVKEGPRTGEAPPDVSNMVLSAGKRDEAEVVAFMLLSIAHGLTLRCSDIHDNRVTVWAYKNGRPMPVNAKPFIGSIAAANNTIVIHDPPRLDNRGEKYYKAFSDRENSFSYAHIEVRTPERVSKSIVKQAQQVHDAVGSVTDIGQFFDIQNGAYGMMEDILAQIVKLKSELSTSEKENA